MRSVRAASDGCVEVCGARAEDRARPQGICPVATKSIQFLNAMAGETNSTISLPREGK
jgi:hypothetical protein